MKIEDCYPALYADGGCVLINPSPVGGTFAWCHVRDGGRIVDCSSGVVVDDMTVHDILGLCAGERALLAYNDGPVSNNVAEMAALMHGLESLPNGWAGNVCSDSQVTLGRVFQGWKQRGLPETWMERVTRAKARLGLLTPVLLQGHPTAADLECGIGAKRQLPVSRWNRWCDERCRNEAQWLLRYRRRKEE